MKSIVAQGALDPVPLRGNGFTFKHFFVAHDRCEMKVGTDAILLGAWTEVMEAKQRILDIGTGSGLLALMLAQRTQGSLPIDAVELDAGSARQAEENFALSPWRSCLHVFHGAIQDFKSPIQSGYDLIVSNPPYYPQGVSCRNQRRNMARYTTTLSHSVLLQQARCLASADAKLSVVLPLEASVVFVQQAKQYGWYLQQQLLITERQHKPPQRVLLLLTSEFVAVAAREKLIIRTQDNRYSQKFCALTKDFYLFF